jgi:hypothetical protein
MDNITIIGTLASLLGAAISVWQAMRSRNAASEAIRIKNQLIGNQSVANLAKLQACCGRAQFAMRKYGPASKADSLTNLKGAPVEHDAMEVQDLISQLKEHRDYFGNNSPNEADELSEKLTKCLIIFSQAEDENALRNNGISIVTNLNSVASVIKSLVDKKAGSIF